MLICSSNFAETETFNDCYCEKIVDTHFVVTHCRKLKNDQDR